MNTENNTIATETETVQPAKTKTKKPAKAKPLVAKSPAAKPSKPKAKDGEISFREGTKRRACYDALVRKQGCTLAQAHEFLGWATSVCGSEMREISKLTGRKLTRNEAGAYRLA